MSQNILNLTTAKEELSFISRYLMLNGSFTRNLGLMNGKMGFVLFFYHYAKYSKNKLYRRFAKELLMEIYNEIDNTYPCNFSDGLCGIAWSMTYLIRNGFVSSDDEQNLLSDLDAKIMKWNIRLLYDTSLETGILGLGHYILSRYNPKERKFYLPLDYLQKYFKVAQQNNLHEINQIMFEIESGQLTHKDYFNIFFLYGSFKRNIAGSKSQGSVLVNGEAGRGLKIMLGGDIATEKQ
ncbi:MAG: hypothetical protein K5672_03070 [Bacteroidaceae bacterium]|nr:hypothetical protein [Bacteroidaceae bacterium]